MAPIKKIINDPHEVAKEALEGLALAYHDEVTYYQECATLILNGIPEGKVGLLVGGGSGHEPLFSGYVGENMADGAVNGDIFAAPTPDKILCATEKVDQGNGVLYLYGNYAGDNMNFDIAAELAEIKDIKTRTVRVWDDVASAPLERIEDRRGIAGDLFVIKIAGAAAATIKDLDEVYRIAVKARDNVRSIGVALSPGSIPETGDYTFELGADELEIGMGLHGEQGVSREKMKPANVLVEDMLNKILPDLPFFEGDRVCLLINNLGASTMMELLIINRRSRELLDQHGIRVHDTLIGSYCTSQEMAGFSITLLKLDDELQRYYDMPTRSYAFTKR